MKNKKNLRKLMLKYLNMTKEERANEISEWLNGKPTYSDSAIAFGIAIRAFEK